MGIFFEYNVQKCPEKRDKDLFTIIKNSTDNGKSSPMVGFIVKVKDPFSRVIFQELGEGKCEDITKFGYNRILNYTYKGIGEVFARFTILDNGNDHWDTKQFKITIIKDESTPGDLITNFYKVKAVGMAAGERDGLDIAFLISSGRTLKHTQWIFGDESPPKSIQKPDDQDLQYSAHHIYGNAKEEYNGSVTVWDHEDNHKTIDFKIIMAEM